MRRVHVNCYIHAPVESVFAHVTDNYKFFSGGAIRSVRMTHEGSPAPHGLGAVREIKSGPLTFVEEITGFEPGRAQEYLIRKCTLPLRHEGGRLDFIARGEGTEIDWNSWFYMDVPLVKKAATANTAQILTAEFTRLLLQAKGILEA